MQLNKWAGKYLELVLKAAEAASAVNLTDLCMFFNNDSGLSSHIGGSRNEALVCQSHWNGSLNL